MNHADTNVARSLRQEHICMNCARCTYVNEYMDAYIHVCAKDVLVCVHWFIQGGSQALIFWASSRNSGPLFASEWVLWQFWEPSRRMLPSGSFFSLFGPLFVGSQKHECVRIRKAF